MVLKTFIRSSTSDNPASHRATLAANLSYPVAPFAPSNNNLNSPSQINYNLYSHNYPNFKIIIILKFYVFVNKIHLLLLTNCHTPRREEYQYFYCPSIVVVEDEPTLPKIPTPLTLVEYRFLPLLFSLFPKKRLLLLLYYLSQLLYIFILIIVLCINYYYHY